MRAGCPRKCGAAGWSDKGAAALPDNASSLAWNRSTPETERESASPDGIARLPFRPRDVLLAFGWRDRRGVAFPCCAVYDDVLAVYRLRTSVVGKAWD